MALIVGTNTGFVSTAPTADPAGGADQADDSSHVTSDSTGASDTTVTEVGWYTGSDTEDVNFEVGLYAADGASDEAGTLLEVERTNAKGTGAGWKVVTGLNWTVSSSTAYWLAMQLDNTSFTEIDIASSNGTGRDAILTSQTTLPDPYGAGELAAESGQAAIYAIVSAAADSFTEITNIGEAFVNSA